MDREKYWQLLRKEFQIPRNVLKISLVLLLFSNLAFLWLTMDYFQRAKMLEIEAQLTADSAANELAKIDFASGRSRFLRIEFVDLSAGAANEFEETTESENALPVWNLRCVKFHPATSSVFAESFVEEYNRTIESLRRKR